MRVGGFTFQCFGVVCTVALEAVDGAIILKLSTGDST
jgi:hypothetical protein